MIGSINLIKKLIGQAVAKEAGSAGKRSLPSVISISVSVILILMGMVCAIITAYMYFSEYFVERHAILFVSLGLFMLAILCITVARYILSKDIIITEEKEPSADNKNEEMYAALGMEAGKIISKHPTNAALIAMAVGVSLGVSPELRNALINQLFPNKVTK